MQPQQQQQQDPAPPQVGNSTPLQWLKHWRAWASAAGIHNMLTLVKALLPVRPEDFDRDDWVVNCLNCTIVLDKATGRHVARPHCAEDLITKVWHATYAPDATHPDLEWYRQTFLPEADRWAFVEEALGYSLTGEPKRFNFQLLGPSHAGKSMFLRLLKTHAADYGTALAYTALKADEHGGDRPRSDLLSLRGARILTISEVGEGAVWSTALFKQITSGGDVASVQGAYARRHIRFAYTVSLWTSGNRPYGASSNDDAAYTRVHVIKFEHPMPVEQQDDRRENEIVDPARTGDDFLAIALRGFSRLYGEKGGRLVPPDSIRTATDETRDSLDVFTRILDELVEITGDANDGVLREELAENACSTYLQANTRVRWGYKELDHLWETLRRRAGRSGQNIKLTRSSTRYKNASYWRGISWTEDARKNFAVTLPNWQETTETTETTEDPETATVR